MTSSLSLALPLPLSLPPDAVPACGNRAGRPEENDPGWQGRSHFFAAAAEAMRRILVDSARRKRRVKHGGNANRVELDAAAFSLEARADHVLAVDEELDALAGVDEQAAQVIKLHYFVGMTMEETARTLGISPRSAHRNWAFARAWLHDRLEGSFEDS